MGWLTVSEDSMLIYSEDFTALVVLGRVQELAILDGLLARGGAARGKASTGDERVVALGDVGGSGYDA